MQNHPPFPRNILKVAGFISVVLFALTIGRATANPPDASSAPAVEIHVAPNGNDGNPGTAARPLATLSRAQDVARAWKAQTAALHGRAIHIVLHGGEYLLGQPVVLTAEDSGVPGNPMVIEAAPGEKPVLTSAVPITGWRLADTATQGLATEAQGKVFVASIPKGWHPHFLYADGKTMVNARWHKTDNWHDWAIPVKESLPQPGGQEITIKEKDILEGLPNNGDVEMNLLPECFWNTLAVVRDIDSQNGTFRSHSKNPVIALDRKSPGQYFSPESNRFTLMNALKFLTQPGEWCVDSASGKLYFWPGKGMPDGMVILAPKAYRLVTVAGSAASPVHDIVIRGLTLQYTDRMPEDQWPDAWIKRNAELPDAMLFLENTERCTVEDCEFTHSGSYAVALNALAQEDNILRNEMGFLGCGGVLIQGLGLGEDDVSNHNTVSRNYIHDTGNGGYMHSAAVTLFQSGGNTLSLNWIDHTPYAAIQISGCYWGEHTVLTTGGPNIFDSYGDNHAMYGIHGDKLFNRRDSLQTRESWKPLLHSRNNRIEDNIVTHYMEKLNDGGALYSWSCGTGNLWRGNLLHSETRGWSVVALYMDDSSDDSTLENNIAWHASNPITSRGENIVFRNNLISGQKPAGFDQRMMEIAHEAAQAGGWPAHPEDSGLAPLLITGTERFIGTTTISVLTSLDGTVHYTLDGSEPAASSPLYTNSVTLDHTATVRATLFSPAGVPLASAQQSYTRLEAKPLVPGQWVLAPDVLEIDGPKFDDKKENIGDCEGGGVFAFGPFLISAPAVQALELKVAVDPRYAGGTLHLHLDSKDGPEIGFMIFRNTGGWDKFESQMLPLKAAVSGSHTFWFVLEGGIGLCNFHGFRLSETATAGVDGL